MSYMDCPACNLCVDNVEHVRHATGSKEEALVNIMSLPKVLRFPLLYGASPNTLQRIWERYRAPQEDALC